MYIRVVLLAVEIGLSGRFLGGERTLLLGRQAAVILEGHVHIAAYSDRLTQGALRTAEQLRGFRMAVLFCKFDKRDTAHGVVLYIDFHAKYDRRYCM